MNCKPGDLAFIRRPWLIDEDIGRVVRVIRLGKTYEKIVMRNGVHSICTNPSRSVGWLVDSSNERFPCFVADECLRPIRDPGDDAVDEMVLRNPIRQAEHA